MSSSKKQPLLNKLEFQGPVWLASDIHLGPDNPVTSRLFYEFLDQASAHAGALLLLGDIFDVWIGDDSIKQPPEWLRLALHNLKATATRIPLWIGRGNRDFLMGSALCDQLSANLLDDQTLLQVGSQRILLAHGDEFCTSDKRYQRFRRIVRHPAVQAAYLMLGLGLRQTIARRARAQSMKSQRQPMAVFHDVDGQAITDRLKQVNAQTLIHGHTHRPGHHFIGSDPITIDRWVLPDWEADHLETGAAARGGWLVVDETGIHPTELSSLRICLKK